MFLYVTVGAFGQFRVGLAPAGLHQENPKNAYHA